MTPKVQLFWLVWAPRTVARLEEVYFGWNSTVAHAQTQAKEHSGRLIANVTIPVYEGRLCMNKKTQQPHSWYRESFVLCVILHCAATACKLGFTMIQSNACAMLRHDDTYKVGNRAPARLRCLGRRYIWASARWALGTIWCMVSSTCYGRAKPPCTRNLRVVSATPGGISSPSLSNLFKHSALLKQHGGDQKVSHAGHISVSVSAALENFLRQTCYISHVHPRLLKLSWIESSQNRWQLI